ncbi:MAG: hypothetical protein AMXMBFR58_33040 [Phycisphaerae bacterium]
MGETPLRRRKSMGSPPTDPTAAVIARRSHCVNTSTHTNNAGAVARGVVPHRLDELPAHFSEHPNA